MSDPVFKEMLVSGVEGDAVWVGLRATDERTYRFLIKPDCLVSLMGNLIQQAAKLPASTLPSTKAVDMTGMTMQAGFAGTARALVLQAGPLSMALPLSESLARALQFEAGEYLKELGFPKN